MLKLVYCEFLKLKRKKFIFLTIFAAALFPIPMTTFAAKSNLGFDWLYLNIGVFGYFLLLPTVLGILGAILFFSEKTNGTQKNSNTIPISTAALITAKVITILIFSIIYSLATNAATLIGGLIIGSADHILYRLLLGVLIGVMVAVSILPVIAIECLSKKGYIFSIILSFIYASASFAIVFAMSNVLSPLSAVFRWALPHMTTGSTYGLDDWFLSSPACIVSVLFSIILAAFQLAGTNNSVVSYAGLSEGVIWNHFSLFLPFTFTLVVGYSINREYTDFTLKNILTVPVSKFRLILSKLIVGYSLVIFEWIFSFIVTLVIAGIMNCADINFNSCLISLEQLFIVSTCCYIAVLPVIVITTRKQDKFLSGVIFSFFYGFCGIFLADGNLINLYPMTTGLVFSNYAHDEKVVYYPALSTSVMVIIFIGTIILLKVLNRQHNDI